MDLRRHWAVPFVLGTVVRVMASAVIQVFDRRGALRIVLGGHLPGVLGFLSRALISLRKGGCQQPSPDDHPKQS